MRNRLAFASFGLSLVAALAIWWTNPELTIERQKQPLGLMTSLPIYWSGGEIGDMLVGETEQHWVRTALEKDHELVLLDRFAGPDVLNPSDQFGDLRLAILAQPAALPPADLVALDDWVRSGGRLLLFADPMLTEETDFGIGDKRRPQDIATISPLLKRWGLQEVFAADQAKNATTVAVGNIEMPAHLFGQLTLSDSEDCVLMGGGLIAQCTIGEGRAVIVSDAHMLAREPPSPVKIRALRYLLNIAFRQN